MVAALNPYPRQINITVNAGGTGGDSSIVLNEAPIGLIDGINKLFETEFDFKPETLQVFIGVKLDVGMEFTILGANSFELNEPALIGEAITVNYKKV